MAYLIDDKTKEKLKLLDQFKIVTVKLEYSNNIYWSRSDTIKFGYGSDMKILNQSVLGDGYEALGVVGVVCSHPGADSVCANAYIDDYTGTLKALYTNINITCLLSSSTTAWVATFYILCVKQ